MKKFVPKDSVLIPHGAERVFKGQIFDVYQWPQKMFDGSEATFEMLKRPDTVTVIPVVEDKILTLHEEQPHIGTRFNVPGGRVDAGESSLEAAKREIHEETGHDFSSWKLVSVVQPHFKLEWFIYFYVAWDGKKTGKPHLDPGEKIKLAWLTFDEVKQRILAEGGFLGEPSAIFKKAGSVKDLIDLPEFIGREVDR